MVRFMKPNEKIEGYSLIEKVLFSEKENSKIMKQFRNGEHFDANNGKHSFVVPSLENQIIDGKENPEDFYYYIYEENGDFTVLD